MTHPKLSGLRVGEMIVDGRLTIWNQNRIHVANVDCPKDDKGQYDYSLANALLGRNDLVRTLTDLVTVSRKRGSGTTTPHEIQRAIANAEDILREMNDHSKLYDFIPF